MCDTGDGLFQEWFKSISSILNQSGNLKEISSQFGLLRSDEERISFGLSLTCVHDVMSVEPCFNPKSASESARLRNEGNKLFQKNRYHQALEVYSCSILNAPVESHGHELSLAFANRSAVLFHLREYRQCLEDIEQALRRGYPNELRYKLFDRQGKCFFGIGQSSRALNCFQKAMESLNESKLDHKKREVWLKDLEMEICKSQETKMDETHVMQEDLTSNNVNFPTGAFQLPQLTHKENSKFTSASCAIDIATSPVTGRHPVATQDIHVGDILVIEKPFASVLLPEHVETHCYHCLRWTAVPLPCYQCSTVRYCSKACAKQSWDSYHSVECQYLDLIHRAGIGKNGHLALRIITKAGYEFLKDFKQEIQQGLCESDSRESGCRHDGSYVSSDYLPIYCLVTHSEDRSISDLFRRTMMAVFLLKTLQGGTFFGKKLCSQKDLAFIGGLILRHLQSNPCNAHEVSELQLNLNSVATSETSEIASGIYATLSLFNHSCDPTVTRNFYGDTCVVRAIKNIPVGHEISDNYGTLSAVSVKSERHDKLKSQYYFTCQCGACKENFPLYSEIPSTASPVFKCENCRTPLHHVDICKDSGMLAACPQCQRTYNLSEIRATLTDSTDLFQQAMDTLLLKADVEGTLSVFISHLRLLEKIVCRPWKDYNNCQEAIKQCYSIMGNCHVMR
ncbi:hypothetical protein ACROYT_G038079 [Oculina patagonica]